MRRRIISSTISSLVIVALAAANSSSSNNNAYAQPDYTELIPQVPATIQPDRTFESVVDGFRLKMPAGWVVEDFDNEHPDMKAVERLLGGLTTLATLCSEYNPGLGGTYDCANTDTTPSLVVGRLSDLKSRPAVQSLIISQNKSITTQDLVTLFISEPRVGNANYKVLDSWDREVNVVSSNNSSSGGAIIPTAKAPAKLVRLSYTDNLGRENVHTFMLFVLGPDGNTGYLITSPGQLATATAPIAEAQQVFDSFELIQR
jgi:hypothetical protein